MLRSCTIWRSCSRYSAIRRAFESCSGCLKSEMCVCDIAEMLSLTPSAISHQLKLLKQFKLVKSRRDRKTIYYSLADDHVRSIIDMGREHIEEQSGGQRK